MKIYLASFNRASNGALSKLVQRLKEENMWTNSRLDADYILAVGDRTETFDFVLEEFRKEKPIIHLWAGEISQGTEDEVYRHAMTNMSELQLCTNIQAEQCVKDFCEAIGKKSNTYVIGNVMFDNLEIDETESIEKPYNLILYNPPTLCTRQEVAEEVNWIDNITQHNPRVWITPNGDKHSDIILPFTNSDNLPRPKFLGLLKNCKRFITNSSCAYYEAPFVMKKVNITMVGERNRDRNSTENMDIPNATENIIKILKEKLK